MASFDFSLGSLVGGSEAEKRAADSLVTGAEVFLGSLGIAYAQTKMPQYQQVAGIDTSLIAGLGLAAISMFDKSGKWGPHVAGFAYGGLGVYGTKLGMSLGAPATQGSPKGLGMGAPAFGVPANYAQRAAR